uniref:ORF34 n=1 Tax=Nitrosopumilaceae spindle-shaped virus TaxID=3065433 RepID=A0AAT9J7N1_9VIRU
MIPVNPETLKHNLTLTEREEKIILIKYIIHGVSPFYDAPLETRIKMLQAAAEVCGYDYNDAEFQEIGRACLAVQEKINGKLLGFVKDNEDLIKTVYRDLKAGNDVLFTVFDKHLAEGLRKLLKK